jgi:hypothetical protein
MTLKRYTIKVVDSVYWEEIHSTLCGVSSCEHIPDRQVTCFDEKCHSPTRGTFILYSNEAESLKNDPRISWVELDISTYPEEYPKPELYIKRWDKNVKIYRDLGANAPVSIGATEGEIDRTGWQVIRTGIKTNGDWWGTATGNPPPTYGDASYSLTGKNVDVIIHDAGVLQYHPEFLDKNGQSRVKDIVLDGPYYIDPDYFNNIIPSVKYIKADGRIGIATTSARDWWQNSSKRSIGFSTIGTISIPTTYTENNSMGTSLDGSNNLISGHGTSSASLVAGKSFGLAFESNIWNMPGISDNVGVTPETNYDLIKLFHLYKPTNPETKIKNPTIVNGSWGYQAGFRLSNTNIQYQFRGSSGLFLNALEPSSTIVNSWKNGFNNQVTGAYKSWASSSRSSSTDEAANEMMATGVIYVAAAGNNNQRLGIGLTDIDLYNAIQDLYYFVGDSRFGNNLLAPTSHRNWMNPQGIGYDEDQDFHPVICVGAMDEYILEDGTYSERKASYSNNGPGIDVWSPADETLAAGTNGVTGYEDFQRADDSRFYDSLFNGTSAAAPVACGLLALYLQSNPKATSKDVKNWLKRHGSVVVESSQYLDQYQNDNEIPYWDQTYNMRGAERRILYNPFSNDTKPTLSGINISGVEFDIK